VSAPLAERFPGLYAGKPSGYRPSLAEVVSIVLTSRGVNDVGVARDLVDTITDWQSQAARPSGQPYQQYRQTVQAQPQPERVTPPSVPPLPLQSIKK
jgi:hypothetical protein